MGHKERCSRHCHRNCAQIMKSDLSLSNQRPRLFVANRLDNIPGIIEHLNLRASIAGGLPCVAER
jgi:hypothetical protein